MKEVFAAVTTARQNRDKLMSEAQSQQFQISNEAGARAASITNAAESARTRFVTAMASDAGAFTSLLPEYQKNPRLFAELELAKTMSVVLTNVQDKIFLPQRADGKPRELRLMLNREPIQKNGGN